MGILVIILWTVIHWKQKTKKDKHSKGKKSKTSKKDSIEEQISKESKWVAMVVKELTVWSLGGIITTTKKWGKRGKKFITKKIKKKWEHMLQVAKAQSEKIVKIKEKTKQYGHT